MNSYPFSKGDAIAAQRSAVDLKKVIRGRLTLLAILLAFFATGSLHAQWTPVWGGSFPGTNGTTYNHANWWNDVQPNAPWGDGTVQNTSDSTNNVYVDGNGNLVLAMTYTVGAASPYTSARLTSKQALGPYGRFDTSIQNPSAAGMGAAFWAQGADAYPAATAPGTANPSTNGGIVWPACGELDMMEIQAKTATHNGSTIHGSDAPVGGSGGDDIYVSATVDLTSPQTFDNGFHKFTTQWAPYHMQYFLDGASTPYGDVNLADTGASDNWELNQPINVILSSGIGGNGGTPATAGFPSKMTIQYVNYSQWSAGPPAPVSGLTGTAPFSNAVDLIWNASSTSGVTYDIYASTTPAAPLNLNTLVAQNVSTTTYEHTALQPNTTYYYTVVAANFGGESAAPNGATATVTTQAPGNSTGMQFSAGGWATGTYMNSLFVAGGNTNAHLHVPIIVSGLSTTPAPQQIYDTERWGPAAWAITGLNPGGAYTVRMHFAETTHTGPGQRNFNVFLNSYPVLTNFDIAGTANGVNIAVTEEFSTLADASGIIELNTALGTSSVADLNPTISGIEIIPGATSPLVGATPGAVSNLSIDSGGSGSGKFVADEDFFGGDVASPAAGPINISATNAAPEEVYLTQRFTPSAYVLSGLFAGATYDVRMHFAETYSGITGSGQRIFNVNVNGQPALTNFDIYAAAGGDNIAVVKDSAAIADLYGQIIVGILRGPAQNPQINGLEILQLSSAVGAPGKLTATLSNGTIALSWQASSTVGVTYTVYRGTPGSAPTVLKAALSGLFYSDSAVTNGTTYLYYVIADLGNGVSPQTNWVTATAGGSGGSGSAPTPPTGLSASAVSSSQINLSWTASTTSGVTYSIFRSTTTPFTPSAGDQIGPSVSGTSYSDSGLATNTSYYYAVEATDSGGSSAATLASATTQSASGGGGGTDVVTIDAGSPAAVGSYVADTTCNAGAEYDPGQTITIPVAIASIAAPEKVYESACQGAVTYTIGGLVSGNSYTVVLHFAELYFPSAGSREFNVAINGTPVAALQNFDIVAATGARFTAVVEKVPNIVAANGKIVISFTNGAKDQPMINGIEIQGAPAPPTALSIDAGSSTAVGSYAADTTCSPGAEYDPGQTITIPTSIANTAAPEKVYESACQGAVTYTLTGFANNSVHTVNLHFAELYFPSAGSREFNVAINGTSIAALQNFDIVAAAGARFTAVDEAVPNITATGGQIVISFTNGAKDQPMINGISVQ